MNKGEKKISYKLYLSFLKGEIPNLLQIIGIPSLLGKLFFYLHKLPFGDLPTSVLSASIALLLWMYLMEMLGRFLTNQITDPFSIMNRKKIKDDTIYATWKWYSLATAIVLSVITGIVVNLF